MSMQPKIAQSHCNKCGQETKHDVLMERKHSASEMVDPYQGFEVSWSTTYSMLECRGCEEVSLCRTTWCSEDDPMDELSPGTYFPPRVSRRKPAWMDRLSVPDEYECLLDEIYIALHADSRRLAAMGARALIDAYITRRVGDQGDFAKGLKKLVEENHIREAQREIVAAAVDAGNASAHRGHCPSVNDISAVIDIVENLIHNELLAEQAQTLRANTPPRPKPGVDKAQPKA
jgi:Domain of unknown function (DUF4145)